MSQPNGYTSDKAVATKAKTTDALRAEIVPPPTQEVLKASDGMGQTLRETLFHSQARKAQVEVIIQSFQAELADINKCIDAAEAGITILEEKNRPQFTAIDGGAS